MSSNQDKMFDRYTVGKEDGRETYSRNKLHASNAFSFISPFSLASSHLRKIILTL